MNENENEKKPEEGEAAAPATEETAPVTGAAETPAADTQEQEAPAPEQEAPEQEAAAPAEEAAAPAADSEPETEATPVAAMFQDPPAESAPEPAPEPEPAPRTAPWWSATRSSDLNPAPETPAEPAAESSDSGTEAEAQNAPGWVSQPFDQPDPGAGAEASEDTSSEPPLAAAAAGAAAAMAEPAAEPEPQPEPEPLPLRIYEYRFIRVKQNTWDSVEAAILSTGAAAVGEAGGQLYGVWAGQIGLSANQGIVVTVWTELHAAKRNGDAAIKGIADVSASEALYLEPTTRPLDATAPEGPGMFAHRVFEVRRDDADRFIELSDNAWPQFEEVFGTKIFALWRETGHERAYDRLVLLTRYPDYAPWANSRFWRPEPDPNAADALAKFRERREITVDTVVYTTRLAVAAAE